MEILAALVFLLLFAVALAGIILPVLPGVPIAALGALLAGWITGFERLSLIPLIIVGALTVLAQLVEIGSSWVGARYYGAGRPGLWGGVIGSLMGLILFPPFGFLVGALVGAVLFELLAGRAFNEAVKAGVGAFVGTLGGAVAKVVILVAIGVVVLPRLWPW
ncbi:MAG TPA: DUF456 domain-containing protein [Trueperaceae bacterium]